MPNTASAKKALRQSERRRARNTQEKRRLKQLLKDYKRLIAESNTTEAEEKLRLVYKNLDKAAKTGLIKKGRAARLKSRFALKLKTSSLSGSPESQVK